MLFWHLTRVILKFEGVGPRVAAVYPSVQGPASVMISIIDVDIRRERETDKSLGGYKASRFAGLLWRNRPPNIHLFRNDLAQD